MRSFATGITKPSMYRAMGYSDHSESNLLPPNDTAQQPRGRGELGVSKTLHAPAVCCSGWFGLWRLLGTGDTRLLPAGLAQDGLGVFPARDDPLVARRAQPLAPAGVPLLEVVRVGVADAQVAEAAVLVVPASLPHLPRGRVERLAVVGPGQLAVACEQGRGAAEATPLPRLLAEGRGVIAEPVPVGVVRRHAPSGAERPSSPAGETHEAAWPEKTTVEPRQMSPVRCSAWFGGY